MFSIAKICKNFSLKSQYTIQTRYKKKIHWAKARKKDTAKYKAQDHFDDFYGSVFGKKWDSMKKAMLKDSKYVALVNNYGDTEETEELLSARGAHCLKTLLSVQQEFDREYKHTAEDTDKNNSKKPRSNSRVENYIDKLHSEEVEKIYPTADGAPEILDQQKSEKSDREQKLESTETRKATLHQSLLEAEIDESRIIYPSSGLSSEILYQYIPASKIKGLDDDFILESEHYSYYSKDNDEFPLIIEPETEFQWPEHLKVYTYEKDSEYDSFPEPKRCKTGVYNYYPMDCGSVLAALALCLSPGDRVLDMCAAPGGKSLVALQTLLPDVLICNDISISRNNRLQRVFKDYLFDYDSSNLWRERVIIQNLDGRYFMDDMGFDKVLVDVPCTTDRVSMNVDENNIFRPDRVRERLRLPEMQAQLLANALTLVKVGGAVVYSTCSLSPIQNDGVVHMALRQVFQQWAIVASIKNLTEAMAGFSSTLNLGKDDAAPKYGQLVTPSIGANFGPSYICRLQRVR